MAHTYETNDPKGWCGDPKRGAALGRHTIAGDRTYAGKLYLRYVALDSGGYDRLGTYFGRSDAGGRVYWYAATDGSIDGTLRAENRANAKARVAAMYPAAKFYG